MRRLAFLSVIVSFALPAFSATTQPTTGAATPADSVLQSLIQTPNPSATVIQPTPDLPQVDATSGQGAVAPDAPEVKLVREGSYIVNRIGRLSVSKDNPQQYEFNFESDGKAMQDPPMIILPNLMLMSMQAAVNSSNKDLKFRITGMVTEYNGRNCVLIQKVVPVHDEKTPY